MSMPKIFTENAANLYQIQGDLNHLDFWNNYRKEMESKNNKEINGGDNDIIVK